MEIAFHLPPGVAGNSDSAAFEILVCLMEQFRHNRGGMSGSLVSLLLNLMGKFGLTPADRAKITIPAAEEKDALETFLNGRTQ